MEYCCSSRGLFSGNHYYCAATQLGACYQGESVVPTSVGLSYQNVARSGNLVIGTAVGGTVPEPGTLMIFGSGIVGIAGFLRRKINR